MRKVIVFTNLTLDGVMQGPGRPDEDRRGGFEHGGWAAPYNAMNEVKSKGLENAGPLLFGRRTYEDFFTFWSSQPGNPYIERLTNTPKYVASRTLQEPLPWENSTLLDHNVPGAIAALKAQGGENLLVMGSGELVQTLIEHDLVDRYVLLIHPLILGSGRRLFRDGSGMATLELIDSQTMENGVVAVTYRPKSK